METLIEGKRLRGNEIVCCVCDVAGLNLSAETKNLWREISSIGQ